MFINVLIGISKSLAFMTLTFAMLLTLFFYDGWSKGELNKKNAKEIEDDVLATYKILAKGYLQASAADLLQLKSRGTFREVNCDENYTSSIG